MNLTEPEKTFFLYAAQVYGRGPRKSLSAGF